VNLCRSLAHLNSSVLEIYNFSDTNLTAGGGEYANQEGFGWTNAVYLRLVKSNNQILYFFENAVS
jgi:alpha,alpha-trehalase